MNILIGVFACVGFLVILIITLLMIAWLLLMIRGRADDL